MLSLMPRLLCLALLLAGACAHDPEPAATASTPASAPAPIGPRQLTADLDRTHITLTEGEGFLIDGTAPPPPPGQTPTMHPRFHGSCGGEALVCSRAGNVVRSAATLDDIATALRAQGFTVSIAP
jgi:hypothetical protein